MRAIYRLIGAGLGIVLSLALLGCGGGGGGGTPPQTNYGSYTTTTDAQSAVTAITYTAPANIASQVSVAYVIFQNANDATADPVQFTMVRQGTGNVWKLDLTTLPASVLTSYTMSVYATVQTQVNPVKIGNTNTVQVKVQLEDSGGGPPPPPF